VFITYLSPATRFRLHIGAKPKPQAPKLALNFGKIICKHHPDIKVQPRYMVPLRGAFELSPLIMFACGAAQGPQIGQMVIQAKQWTLETGTSDEALVEEFIKNLTIQ
jgi:hypothetical protein